MKLSTQYLVANLLCLVLIWWCAFHPSITNLVVACIVCPLMFLLRVLSLRAARREHDANVAAIKAKIAALRARIAKEKGQ